jgi:hypothetical protein
MFIHVFVPRVDTLYEQQIVRLFGRSYDCLEDRLEDRLEDSSEHGAKEHYERCKPCVHARAVIRSNGKEYIEANTCRSVGTVYH